MTGIVGFAKDYGTTASFSDSSTDEILTLIQNGTAPAMQACPAELLALAFCLLDFQPSMAIPAVCCLYMHSLSGAAHPRGQPAAHTHVLGRECAHRTCNVCQLPFTHDAPAQGGERPASSLTAPFQPICWRMATRRLHAFLAEGRTLPGMLHACACVS